MPSRQQLANAIRALSMDAVQAANSGHPGMPMGMADIAEVLWNDFLKHNPQDPSWANRDRFVLSNGHGSMLLYSLLHLSGYDLSLDELKNFRQLHAKTPGHPEYGMTPGVETTTGPLGQGLANAVGMALAEARLAAEFNRDGLNIVDHHTWVFSGDGCLMEGVSHEVCSLAGTLGLGKLNVVWDDNGISIDGKVANWFADDTPARFEAYGWHVVRNIDGHDPEAIRAAMMKAYLVKDKPSLICARTTIGFGSPNLAGTAKSHGAPLGDDEIAKTRAALGWEHAPFEIPADVYQAWNAKADGAARQQEWQATWQAYQQAQPELAAEFTRRIKGELPQDWASKSAEFIKTQNQSDKAIATRAASKLCLDAYTEVLPELFGGSADLSGSNCTKWSTAQNFTPEEFNGRYLHYGVREFGMSAIMNGMALHGGTIPFGGTFLVFSDYARNAVRMAALMQQRAIFVYSHDSIGLGEDGPTHQPIEHIASLRAIPGLDVWRPADAVETAVAWQQALEAHDRPSCLLLSRQGLTAQAHQDLDAVKKGAYVLFEPSTSPEVIIMATGSEVEIAVNAAQASAKAVRVVSMPCREAFLRQDQAYQEQVLPKAINKRIAIEAGVSEPWYRFVGSEGRILGIDRFGESAPYKQIYELFHLTKEHVLNIIEEI